MLDKNYRLTKLLELMPLIFCCGFFVFTILLFAIGPIDWGDNNRPILYIFLTFVLAALVGGYVLGLRIKPKPATVELDLNKIVIASAAVSIINTALILLATTGTLLPNLLGVLGGQAAANYHQAKGDVSSLIYITIIFAPLASFCVPLTIIFFWRLKRYVRVIGCTAAVLTVLLGASQGINFAMAALVLQIVVAGVIYLLTSKQNAKVTKQMFRRRAVLVTLVVAGALSSFVAYNRAIMSSRLAHDKSSTDTSIIDDGEKNENIGNNQITIAKDDFEQSSLFMNPTSRIRERHMLSWLPDSVEGPMVFLVSYLSHGYNGLSLALTEPFTSSYGLGFSDFFRNNFLKVIGKSHIYDDVYSRTFMAKVYTRGWATGAVWSTFFIYPASDISFVGVVPLVGLIGLLLALAWLDVLKNRNPFAAVMFMQIFMMICFFSMSNLYLNTGGNFFTIVVVGALWFLSKRICLKRKNAAD
jgi:hypothetical protein